MDCSLSPCSSASRMNSATSAARRGNRAISESCQLQHRKWRAQSFSFKDLMMNDTGTNSLDLSFATSHTARAPLRSKSVNLRKLTHRRRNSG